MPTASAGALVRQSAQSRRDLVGRLHNSRQDDGGRVGAGRVGCAEERAEAGEQLSLLVSGIGGGGLGGLGGGPRDLYVRIWKVSELITIGAAAPIALGRALKVGIVAPAPLRKWEEAP